MSAPRDSTPATPPATSRATERQTGSGLKRRRDAALRLPPLPSGERDPLFAWGSSSNQLNWAPRSGPSRSPIRVEFDSPRGQAFIRGFGGGDYCRLVGGRGMWLESKSRRGWSTTARTARDVIAAAERDGRLVIITETGGGK